MPENYPKIRSILDQKKSEGFRIGIRLCDFYKWTDRAPEEILKDAARVAIELGATSVAVPVSDLNDEFVKAVIDAAQWAEEEAQRLGKPLPKVLFSVENVTTSGQFLSSEQLNAAFENKPVGVSIWLDSLPEKQIDYVAGMHMVVKELYFGEAFVNKDIQANQRRSLVDKSADLMRWMREQGWVGDAIVHTPDGSLIDRRSFFDDIIRRAYIAKDVVESFETGTVTAPPTLKAVSPVWEASVTAANGAGLVSTAMHHVGPEIATATSAKSDAMDKAVREKIVRDINDRNAGVLVIGDFSGAWFNRLRLEGFNFIWSAESIEEAIRKEYFNENIVLVINASVNPSITERLKGLYKGIAVLQLESSNPEDQRFFWEYLNSV